MEVLHGKDMHESVKWFRLAAEQGHADAQFRLGYGVLRRQRRAQK